MTNTSLDLSARGKATAHTAVRALPKHIHLLGAGGAGLSGAAVLLLERGHVVTGCDREASSFTEKLSARGLTVQIGESTADALPKTAEMIVRSAAVDDDDPQVALARSKKIPVIKYAELLGHLGAERTLAVAGTHGKTTTSWMLHHALRGLASGQLVAGATECAPGALVGGLDTYSDTNAIAPEKNGWLSVEACEYDRSFLNLSPRGAIITNVEADHLDYFGTFEAVCEAFARFANRVDRNGLLVVGKNVPGMVEEAAACEVWRIGREIHFESVRETHGYFHFRVRGPGWQTNLIRLAVPGLFNVENASCAIGLALGLVARDEELTPSLASKLAGEALREFVGVKRRFEPWGQVSGVELVHDYAHHPTEIRATLAAARRAMPGRPLHVLFQPHQYSRTARFLNAFVESFAGAESVVVADVYGARTHIDEQTAGAKELAELIQKTGVDAVAGGSLAESRELFEARLSGGTGALILGAGDIDTIRDELKHNLALRGD